MAFNPWIPITELSISYPDFQWGAVANPDEIDINNSEIVGKLNNLINKVNERFSAIELPYPNGSIINRHYANGSIDNVKISETANISQSKINNTAGWITNITNASNSLSTEAKNNSIEALNSATLSFNRSNEAYNIAEVSLQNSNTALTESYNASVTANSAVNTASNAVFVAEQAVNKAQSMVGNTEILYDVYTIINSDNGDGTFSYKNTLDQVFVGIITPEGNQRFQLTKNYFPGLNRIEGIINDTLIRTMASGGLYEVGEQSIPSNLVDLMPVSNGTEVTFKYYMQLSLGGKHALSHSVYSEDALITLKPNEPSEWYSGQMLLREV